MLLPLEPEVRRVLATMPQEDAATATAAKLSRTYPAGRRKNEEEGEGGWVWAAIVMTAVIRFGEEITMSDYFVINKYKSEEYTRTHINTVAHTVAHTQQHTQ